MGLLDGVKKWFKEMAGPGPNRPGPNQYIVDELMYAFDESVAEMSTSRSLMFHTAYVVYVKHNAYKNINVAFKNITDEVKDRFHERLNQLLRSNSSLKYSPVHNFWSFDLIPLMEHGSDTPDKDNPDSKVTYEELEDKFVAVRSSAVMEELFNFDSFADDEEVRTTRSQPNSVYNRNKKLVIGDIKVLKPSGHGFTYPIILNGGEVVREKAAFTDRPLASIKCCEDDVDFVDAHNNTYKTLDIKVENFFVGGASASSMYQGKPMVRLNSPDVMSPHFEIRQDADGAFYIRPIGDVELGHIPLAKGGWERIPNKNASIFINSEIELQFNKI